MNKKIIKLKKFLVGITIMLLPISFPMFAAPTAPEAPIAPRTTVENPVDSNPEVIPEVIPETLLENVQEMTTQTVPEDIVDESPENIQETPLAIIESTLENSLSQEGEEGSITNTETGYDSSNQLNNQIDSEIDLTNENDAKVDNTVDLEVETGENEANYNTGDGSVETGDSNVVLSILNLINTVFIGKDGGKISLLFDQFLGDLIGDYIVDPNTGEAYSLTGSRLDIGNTNTGSGSTNNAFINFGNNTNIENNNDGTALNNLDVSVNTGNNEASYNTGNGSVTSGDANVSLNILNFLNSTFIATGQGLVGVLNIFGDFVGNLVIPNFLASGNAGSSAVNVSNEETGANSENNANLNVDNALDIDNDNQADISNELELSGNTGNNESNHNTGSGQTDTGNVNIDLGVNNVANQNIIGDTIFYTIINVLGEWTGANLLANLFDSLMIPNPSGEGQTIILKNKDTGTNSVNSAELNIENETNITNDNQAEIDNKVTVDANTGGNSASYNTGNGAVTSGNVNILANFLNIANVNVVAHKFVFFIVNIFGDWKGDIAENKSSVVAEDTSNDTVPIQVVANNINKVYTGESCLYCSPLSFQTNATNTSYALAVNELTPDSQYVLGASSEFSDFIVESEKDSGSGIQGFLANYSWLILFVLGIFVATCAFYTYKWQVKKDQISY